MFGKWHSNRVCKKCCLWTCVCYILAKGGYSTRAYCLMKEPSSYVISGLRYEGKYKWYSIIGTVCYFPLKKDKMHLKLKLNAMDVASGWAGRVLTQQLFCKLNVHLHTSNTRKVVGIGHVSRRLPVIVPTIFINVATGFSIYLMPI